MGFLSKSSSQKAPGRPLQNSNDFLFMHFTVTRLFHVKGLKYFVQNTAPGQEKNVRVNGFAQENRLGCTCALLVAPQVLPMIVPGPRKELRPYKKLPRNYGEVSACAAAWCRELRGAVRVPGVPAVFRITASEGSRYLAGAKCFKW